MVMWKNPEKRNTDFTVFTLNYFLPLKRIGFSGPVFCHLIYNQFFQRSVPQPVFIIYFCHCTLRQIFCEIYIDTYY